MTDLPDGPYAAPPVAPFSAAPVASGAKVQHLGFLSAENQVDALVAASGHIRADSRLITDRLWQDGYLIAKAANDPDAFPTPSPPEVSEADVEAALEAFLVMRPNEQDRADMRAVLFADRARMCV
jgi:hypothetical protein